jgi:predicted permease
VLGLILAAWGVRVLIQFAPQQLPRLQNAGVDAYVVAFTTACALLTGLLFGLAPAVHSSHMDLSEAMKQGAHAASSGRRHSRLRGIFVIAEVALAFVLLTGAGLLLRSFAAITRVERGFDTGQVMTMGSSLSFPKLVGARRYAAFYERFLENIARLPGVTAVGASSSLPWTGANDNTFLGIEGRPRDPGQSAHYQFVSPDYLRAIGVPLVAGRWLTTGDHFDAPRVAVVTRTLALRYWPNAEASLGQRIFMGDSNTPGKPLTIIGVAGDVKDSPTDLEAQPALYLPFLQYPTFYNFVAVRAARDPAALIAAVRKLAEQMGNDLSIQEVRPLAEVAAAAVSSQRFSLLLVGLFAALALLLAMIGIYGVMAYATSLREREIAIRIALGAGQMDTLRLLLMQGLRLILAGLAIGGLGAVLLTRVLHGILYQVSATDPLTFVVVAAIEAAVGAAACLAPAWRMATASGNPAPWSSGSLL